MEEHLAIKLDSVTKEYPGVQALKNVNLNIKKKSIHGFLGPNGAGKSTTMKIISGLIPATSGTVEVASRIGFLPENPPLYKNMKVKEFLDFVYMINAEKSYKSQTVRKLAIERVIETCGLTQVAHRFIGHLSKGYKQRVGMAQAMVFNPEILIFDEPTVGLDPQALDEIRSLIVRLSDDHTILLSTHLLHEVSLICTDISIINQGVVVKEGLLSEIQNSIQAGQTILVEVDRWDTQIEQKLRANFQVSDLHVESNNQLEISLREASDQRARLSRFLFENDCNILGFRQKREDLEDIFKKTTSEVYSEVVQ